MINVKWSLTTGKSFDTQYHILHDDKINILEKLDSINDLGVIFDNNLSFKDHISQKINKAYNILRIIKRNFIYMDDSRVRFYTIV